MPDSPILEVLERTSPKALRVSLRPTGSGGQASDIASDVVIEGTPEGFKMLAGILLEMARAVDEDQGTQETGYGLVLSSQDSPQLIASGVGLVSLSCEPNRHRLNIPH